MYVCMYVGRVGRGGEGRGGKEGVCMNYFEDKIYIADED